MTLDSSFKVKCTISLLLCPFLFCVDMDLYNTNLLYYGFYFSFWNSTIFFCLLNVLYCQFDCRCYRFYPGLYRFIIKVLSTINLKIWVELIINFDSLFILIKHRHLWNAGVCKRFSRRFLYEYPFCNVCFLLLLHLASRLHFTFWHCQDLYCVLF